MSAADTVPDHDLLTRYGRRGDQEAFALLVERHGGWVYGLCLRLTGRAADAEDASQETFLALARSACQIRDRLPAWLSTVARRCAQRTIARRPAAEPLPEDAPAVTAQRQDLAHLDEAIAGLPAAQRDVLLARFVAGKRQEAIARELGLSQATVSRRLEQGLDALRLRLAGRSALAILAAPPSPMAAPPSVSAQLGRIALVARPTASATFGASSLRIAGLAVAIIGVGLGVAWWSARAHHAGAPPLAAAPPPPAPAPALPPEKVWTSPAVAGWWQSWVAVPPSVDVRGLFSGAQPVLAWNGHPVAGLGWSDVPPAQSANFSIKREDGWYTVGRGATLPNGTVKDIPLQQLGAWRLALHWDAQTGIPRGAWDQDILAAAQAWRQDPAAALAGAERAVARGCPRPPVALLAATAAAAVGDDGAWQRWSALVPPERPDHWLLTLAAHLHARGTGKLVQARALAAQLPGAIGSLGPELPDVDHVPAWPAAWSPREDLGTDVGLGQAHIWDAHRRVDLASPRVMGDAVAIRVEGRAFTAVPGLAQPAPWVRIALEGMPMLGGASDGGRGGDAGDPGAAWERREDGLEIVTDGTGACVPWLGRTDGRIDVRILAADRRITVWVDGHCRTCAWQTWGGPWRLVISAQGCDLNLPQVIVTSPDARPPHDLIGALIADDGALAAACCAHGADPFAAIPGSVETAWTFAAEGDRCAVLRALEAQVHVPIDARDHHGGTALYRAVDNHALHAAALLLGEDATMPEAHADAQAGNAYRTTPLGYAMRGRDPALIALLLRHIPRGQARVLDDGGATPACTWVLPGPSAAAMVALLRAHGERVDAAAAACAGERDPTALTDPARRAQEGPRLLAMAVLLDDAALVQACLDAGVPAEPATQAAGSGIWLQQTPMSPLLLAVAVTGNPAIAQNLVDHGADPDRRSRAGTPRELARAAGIPLRVRPPRKAPTGF